MVDAYRRQYSLENTPRPKTPIILNHQKPLKTTKKHQTNLELVYKHRFNLVTSVTHKSPLMNLKCFHWTAKWKTIYYVSFYPLYCHHHKFNIFQIVHNSEQYFTITFSGNWTLKIPPDFQQKYRNGQIWTRHIRFKGKKILDYYHLKIWIGLKNV